MEATQTLTKAQATALDKKIRAEAGKARNAVEQVSLLLKKAQAGNVHTTLGFKSWPGYVKDVLSGSVTGVSVQERRVLVALMTGEGMSQRAVAEALGVSQGSVKHDVKVSQIDSPDAGTEVPESKNGATKLHPDDASTSANAEKPKSEAPAKTVGLDGKTYNRTAKPQIDKQAKQLDAVMKEKGLVPGPAVQTTPVEEGSLVDQAAKAIKELEYRLATLEEIRDDAELLLQAIQEFEESVPDKEVIRGNEREIMEQISTHLTDAQWAITGLMGLEAVEESK